VTNLTVAKFGGSLIADASDFRKVVDVIKKEEPSLVVISATKGTTNLLEQIWLFSHQGKSKQKRELIQEFEDRHIRLCKDLNIWDGIDSEFKEIISELNNGPADDKKYPEKDFTSRHLDRLDYLLSLGERTSSLILSHCLVGYDFLFAPDYIKTDSNFSGAQVDFTNTQSQLNSLASNLNSGKKFVTQGFIGSDETGKITTLGREGSDYSATIFAGALNAKTVTIFTDVPGVFESDPKKWSFCHKFNT
jgi:aspartate kinase